MEALCSLYVGDLHPSVTEEQIIKTFSKVDGFISAVLCTDSITGRSLCYGYVNFLSDQHATRAIEMMNHMSMNGKSIRVTLSQSDSEARKSGIGNVFVKNLDISVDNSKLHDIFSKYGKILSCKVAVSPEGKSKGYGYIQFESEESSNNAIRTVNGTIIDGKEIYVSRFIPKSERFQDNSGVKYTNLYVKNLDIEVNEDILREKFSPFGEITSLLISRDDNVVSKGFGFVNFAHSDDARRAEESMHGTQLDSKAIYVARAQTKADRQRILSAQFEQRRKERLERYKGLNVYVKHINESVDDNQLKDYFSRCGLLSSGKIMRDEKGRSKGFGFVCFSTPAGANTAMHTLNGVKFHGKPLYVAIAQTKAERRAYLQSLYARTFAASMYQNFGYQPLWRSPVVTAGLQLPPTSIPIHMESMYNRIPQYGSAYPIPFSPEVISSFPWNRAGNANHWSYGQPWPMSNNNIFPRPMSSSNIVPLANASSSSAKAPKETEDLSSKLVAASAEDRKEMLGHHLYPLVQKLPIQSDLAPKITGMLLEMDNAELLLLLESPESLAAKVEEAVQVLELHQIQSNSSEVESVKIGVQYKVRD